MNVEVSRAKDRLKKLAGLIIVLAFWLVLPILAHGVEGPVIHRIRFEGNEVFNAKTLREQMRKMAGQPDDSLQIQNDADQVIKFYRDNGYLDAELLEIKRIPRTKNALLIDYTITIRESEPYTISEINLEGVKSLKESELRKLLVIKPGDILKTAFISYSEYLMQELYRRNGYVYCRVGHRLEPAPYLRTARSLTFVIDEGIQARVGTVRIDSNETVRGRIIAREIVIKPGEIYNPSKAYESQKRIYGTGLFKDVRFVEVGKEDTSDIIDLVFIVKEDKPRWVGFGGGYQSPNRASFYVNWGHDNLFNNGQRLRLETSYAFNPFNIKKEHEENFAVTHSEPYLFSSKFKGELRLFHTREYRESYDLIESGGNARIGRYMGKDIEGFSQYQFKTASVKIYKLEDIGELPNAEGITNSISLSFTRDTRDNLFDPKTGSLSSLGGDIAGGILGGDNDFYRYVGDVTTFYNPLGDVVFATRARGGVIKSFGSGAVPFSERFPLRGSDAVRGYPEEDLKEGGFYLTTFNVEIRFPLFRIATRYVGLAYFVDMGNASRIALHLDDHMKQMKIGAGAGIRAETPIGPVRLDYARNITGASDTDYGRIYFGIGHMF
jgi:outer membrane protein insertion porin family